MKKLISATAVCALAIGLVAAPGALGVKSPKLVSGTVSVGVTPIPLSVFYSEGGPTDLVRFAFCKKRSVLEEAGRRLTAYWPARKKPHSSTGSP
jgi:hypothetical protein